MSKQAEPQVPAAPIPAVPVVAHDGPAALTQPRPPAAPRGAPKWETDARERVKVAIKRFSKPLADLVARDANEGDTRLLVTASFARASATTSTPT